MINSESLTTERDCGRKFNKGLRQLNTRSGLLQSYSCCQSEYFNSIFSQDIEKVVRFISMDSELFHVFRSQPVYMLVLETVQILMMTLLEAIAFSKALLENLKSSCSLPADVFLIFVGFAVKQFFCEEVELILEYLKTKILNFEDNFQRWEKDSGVCLRFTVKELNRLFCKGRKGRVEMNFNYCVDQVLHISPPYQVESKKVMKMILSDLNEREKEEVQSSGNVYEKIAAVLGRCELGSFECEERKEKDKILVKVALRF